LEELKNDESFDIEIGLYDPQTDTFLASAMNHKLDVRDPKSLKGGKLNYAWMHYYIDNQFIGKHLYLTFRAVNFTVTED